MSGPTQQTLQPSLVFTSVPPVSNFSFFNGKQNKLKRLMHYLWIKVGMKD